MHARSTAQCVDGMRGTQNFLDPKVSEVTYTHDEGIDTHHTSSLLAYPNCNGRPASSISFIVHLVRAASISIGPRATERMDDSCSDMYSLSL